MSNLQFSLDEPPTTNINLQFLTTDEPISQLDFSTLPLTNETLESVDVHSVLHTTPQQVETSSYDPNETPAHWFYSSYLNNAEIWWPFTVKDSELLEKHYRSSWQGEEIIVKKGLYKALLSCRSLTPVFWQSPERSKIRRATWYYQAESDTRLLPFSENTSYSLDGYYNNCVATNQWNVQFQLPSDNYEGLYDTYNIYGPDCIVANHSYPSQTAPAYFRCTISRGLPPYICTSLEIGSTAPIRDVILFIQNPLHSLETTLSLCDQFRNVSKDLLAKECLDKDFLEQFEILPVKWTSEETEEYVKELKEKLRVCSIRNESENKNLSPKDEQFIETMLFWDKTRFTQLVDELRQQINHVINRWKQYNKKDFDQITFHCITIGFSSTFLSEILTVNPLMITPDSDPTSSSEPVFNPNLFQTATLNMSHSQLKLCALVEDPEEKARERSRPSFSFKFKNVFIVGSQLSRYLALSNQKKGLAEFLNCSRLLNVYNPYDEASSRMETYLDPGWKKPPVKIPHYRHGMNRLNLDLKTNLTRVGSDLSNKVFQSLESTLKSFQEFAYSHINNDIPEKQSSEQPSQSNSNPSEKDPDSSRSLESKEAEYFAQVHDTTFQANPHQGLRVDFYLQSAPLESLGQIVFGSGKTDTYVTSQDLVLFILRSVKGCESVSFILNKLTLQG